MQRYQDSVLIQSPTGAPRVGAGLTVTVYNTGTSVLASVYSDNGVTLVNQTTNPITTDANGRFEFYAANGHYDAVISGPTITSITITDILLEDLTQLFGGNLDVQSLNSGQVSGFRNVIVNGNRAISQVNSTNAVTVTAGAAIAYTTDQFWVACTGTNVTVQNVNVSPSNHLGASVVGATTGAIGVTDVSLGQRIEAANTAHLAGKYVMLGVDLSSSSINSVTWKLYSANTVDTFGTLAAPTKTLIATGVFAINGGLTRKFTPPILIPNTATTGLEVVLDYGALTFGVVIDSHWQLEQVSPTATSGTAFEHVDYGTQLARCQRYLPYFNISSYSLVLAALSTTAAYGGPIVFKVPARLPVTGLVTVGTIAGSNSTGGSAGGTLAIYVSSANNPSLGLTGGTGLVAGNTCALQGATAIYFTGAQM